MTGRVVTKRAAKWLTEKIDAGRRYLKAAQCPKCGADVLRGPNGDDMAWITRVDPEPVNEFTEAIERVANGRMSYALITSSAGQRLEYRDHYYRPSKYPIVLDHRCG